MLSTQEKAQIEGLPLFFIIGRARSGTTLIRTLFDAHPRITIPTEAPFILHLSYRYARRTHWDQADLEKFYADLLQVRDFDTWTIDLEKLRSDLLSCQGKTSFQFLCKVVIWNYQSVFDKGPILILGDKNPVYSIALPEIHALFPEARYLYVVRDHRDHILSMLQTGLYSKDVYRLAYRWKQALRTLENLQKTSPDSFLVFRYEDFVAAPERHLMRMCDFLSIPYESALLEFSSRKQEFLGRMPAAIMEKYFKNLFEPINAANCGKWKTRLSEDAIRVGDLVAGNVATRYGYELRYVKDFGFKMRHLGQSMALWFFYLSRPLRIHLPEGIRKRMNLKNGATGGN